MKTKLIVWLGNPWKKYEYTKHNIWFKILDIINYELTATNFLFDKKFNSELSIAKESKYMIIFLKPQTYMNLSWDAVLKIINYYNIESKNLLVMHDEIDLDPWNVKLKWNWWDNWHNWLKDITRKLWTNKYRKLKIWVWRPYDKLEVVNYVLWRLNKNTLESLINQKEYILDYVKQFLINN